MFTSPLPTTAEALSSTATSTKDHAMSAAPLSISAPAFTVNFEVHNLSLTLFVSVNGTRYTVHEDNRMFNDVLRLVMDDRTTSEQLEYALQAARRDDLQRF